MKKRLYYEKRQKLHAKGYELGFLNGLIGGRKKMKLSLVREDSVDGDFKHEEVQSDLDDNIFLEEGSKLRIETKIPKLFKIPFWLVKIDDDQTVRFYLIFR